MTYALPRLSTGIAGLDQILAGGFVEGASYIVQGHPGAGKTILANQVAFANVAQGRKVLYVTLLAETHDRMFQSLSTLDFFDKNRLGEDIIYVSVFQTLRDQGLSAVVSLLRKETARQGATLLVFDGLLNARDRAASDIDVKTFVAEVQSQAAFVGCTVMFLTSASTESDSPEYTMVDGVIELRDEVAGVRSIRRLQVRKSRGTPALGGHHKYEITSSGLRIYPRLEAALSHSTVTTAAVPGVVSSSIAGLDPLLGGGLPEGSVTLLYGPTGSGKTSFGLNFLSGCSAAEPGLHFGFYETPERVILKARALGLDFGPCIDRGHMHIVWQPLTENLLDKLAYRLLDVVAAHGIKRLFIDGLSGFSRAASHPQRLVEFFAALTNELRARGVTTVAAWELQDIVSPALSLPAAEVSSLLDNMILLRNVELDARFKRVISVVKVRDSMSDPAFHEVTIDGDGMKILSPLAPATGVITGAAKPREQ